MTNDERIAWALDKGYLRVHFETGLVYSAHNHFPNRPLGSIEGKGYLRCCLRYEGVQFKPMVHRIVWIAAHGIPDPGLEIDHLNGVKTDNRVSNLEAVTGTENMRRRIAARTHCASGLHAWTEENTSPVQRERRCRICRLIAQRNRTARARAAV